MQKNVANFQNLLFVFVLLCASQSVMAKPKPLHEMPPARPACEDLDLCEIDEDETDLEIPDVIKQERMKNCQAVIAMHIFADNIDKLDSRAKPAKIFIGIKFSELPFEEKQKLVEAAGCVIVNGGKKKTEIELMDGSEAMRVGRFRKGQLFLYDQGN